MIPKLQLRRPGTTQVVLAILAFAVGALAVRVYALESAEPRAAATTAFTYQGRAVADGIPADGLCDFTFRLFDALEAGVQVGSTINRPAVTVANGLFTSQLDFGSVPFENGDQRFLATTMRCPADVGSGGGPLVDLTPRQELTATPYAIYAQHVPFSGIIGLPPALGGDWENVIIVAKSGGDFTSIQAALDTITTSSPTNRYLVWVAPGTYDERIELPAYVTLRGAGKDVVTIRSTGGIPSTVTLPAYTNLEDVTIETTGNESTANPLHITGDTQLEVEVRVTNVAIRCLATANCTGLNAEGASFSADHLSMLVYPANFPATGHAIGILIGGAPGSTAVLRDIDIYVERFGGATQAVGMRVDPGSFVDLDGGKVRANSGTSAVAISYLAGNVFNNISNVHLEAFTDSNGTSAIGILAISDGMLFVRGVTMRVGGPAVPKGISISTGGADIRDADIQVEGNGDTTGIEFANLSQPLRVTGTTIGKVGNSVKYGISSVPGDSGFGYLFVERSTINAQFTAIRVNTTHTVRAAVSLINSRSVTGTFSCAGVYNDFFVPKSATCN